MKTFKDVQDWIEDIWNDTNESAIIQTMINDKYKEILDEYDWSFTEHESTTTTTASTAEYTLPIGFGNLIWLKINDGSVDHYPKVLTSEDDWNRFRDGATASSSDTPEYVFIDGAQFRIWPTPATSSNTITLRYHTRVADLASTDFTDNTAGTVTLTNGATSVAGSGTTFLSTDAGRYIRATTDGYWYPLASFTNTTTMTLDRNFEGTTVSGGAFKIGTLPFGISGNIPPESGAMAICYKVMEELWEKREDFNKAQYYAGKYAEAIDRMKKFEARNDDNPLVNTLPTGRVINPNDYPTNLST